MPFLRAKEYFEKVNPIITLGFVYYLYFTFLTIVFMCKSE